MSAAEKQIRERQEAFDRLRIARAIAIQSYAGLEHALCSLFTKLLVTTPDMAATVFYRNANSRSRNEIVSKLLKKRHGSEYSPFFTSAIKRIKILDDKRNEIVHWHEATDFFEDDAGQTMSRPTLMPRNYWDLTANSRRLGIEELKAFASECDFVTRSLNMFLLLLTGALKRNGSEQPWYDLCRKPMTYPPPDKHPLSKAERGGAD